MSDTTQLSNLIDRLDFESPSIDTLTKLQDVLAETIYENVRAADVCTACSTLTTDPHDPPLFIRHFIARDEWRKNFRSRLRDAPTCWLCRLLCRIVAIGGRDVHSPSGSASKPRTKGTGHGGGEEMAFERCLRLDERVDLAVHNDLWELTLRSSDAAGARKGTGCATSYRLGFAWETLPQNTWGDLPNPSYFGLTRHSLHDPPKTRKRLLPSTKMFAPGQSQRSTSETEANRQDELTLQMQRWLRICEGRHEKCSRSKMQAQSPSKPPHQGFRLIDVNSRKLITPQEACPYVTLSYVWGQNPFVKPVTTLGQPGHPFLVSDLVKQVNKELRLPSTIPQTIEDATTVARMIGQRYLWTDLLCIDQDNAETKAEAIAAMGKVYSDSFLTICVLDGASMFTGIPGVRSAFQNRFQVVTDTEDTRYMFTSTRATKSLLRDASWAKRAWCFQEGELSRRRLCFVASGAFFLCREEIMFDTDEVNESEQRAKRCFQTGQAINQFLPFSFDLELGKWDFGVYARMVTSYSRRSISYASDALNAVAGALDVLSVTLDVKFVAGLPISDMHNALLWMKRRPQEVDTDESAAGVRRGGFPSWSWAGWEGNIEHCFWLEEGTSPNTDIYSFVNLTEGDSGYIYFNSIQVISRASITVEPPTSTSAPITDQSTDRTATLHLHTAVAKFHIKQITTPSPEHSDLGFSLLDSHGTCLPRGTAPSIHYPLDYDVWPLVWFPLHVSMASQLCGSVASEKGDAVVVEVEIALLQHWATVPSTTPPRAYDRSDFEEVPPGLAAGEETVYAVVLKRVGADDDGGDNGVVDGADAGIAVTYERLNLVAIPARLWLDATPQMSDIRLV